MLLTRVHDVSKALMRPAAKGCGHLLSRNRQLFADATELSLISGAPKRQLLIVQKALVVPCCVGKLSLSRAALVHSALGAKLRLEGVCQQAVGLRRACTAREAAAHYQSKDAADVATRRILQCRTLGSGLLSMWRSISELGVVKAPFFNYSFFIINKVPYLSFHSSYVLSLVVGPHSLH